VDGAARGGSAAGAVATGARRTSTSSTSGIPSKSARTASIGRAVARSAVTRRAALLLHQRRRRGIHLQQRPRALQLALHDQGARSGGLAGLGERERHVDPGQRRIGARFSGPAWAAPRPAPRRQRLRGGRQPVHERPRHAGLGGGLPSVPEARRTCWASASVACKSRSTCARSGRFCCALSLPISVSAAWATSTSETRPTVAPLPFTECTRRKIESHSGRPAAPARSGPARKRAAPAARSPR